MKSLKFYLALDFPGSKCEQIRFRNVLFKTSQFNDREILKAKAKFVEEAFHNAMHLSATSLARTMVDHGSPIFATSRMVAEML